MLRIDARVVPHDQRIRIYEPSMQRFAEMERIDCRIAQLMDGRRGLDELWAIGTALHPSFTRATLETLVLSLNNAGLLNHVFEPALDDQETEIGTNDDIDGPTVLSDGDSLSMTPSPPPVLRVVRTAEIPVTPDPDEDSIIVDPAVPTEAPDAEEQAEPDAASPEEVAAQEQAAQEAIWNAAHAHKWHQRKLVRFVLALAVITGLAAIIPYPLRVTSDCKIIPNERATVRSELQGVLAEILVDEGDTVKKGQTLARLDDRALKAERLGVVAELEKAQAELATLRQGRRPEEIEQQRAVLAARRNEVAFAAKEARRRGQMAKEGVGTRQQADEASRELVSKSRAVEEASAALKLLEAGSRPEEIAAQEAVVKREQAQLAYIDERLAMTLVRAPIDGIIQTARFRERLNEAVEAGGLVCEIANTRRMRAEILVPEREVDSIAVGMPATVKVESFPTRPFEGKVNFIAPAVDGQDKRVRVVVELENADGQLKANMTGYGEIEVGDRSLLTLATRRVTRWIRVRFLL